MKGGGGGGGGFWDVWGERKQGGRRDFGCVGRGGGGRGGSEGT